MSINYVSRSAVSYLDYVKIFEVKTVKSPKLLWRLNPLWAFGRNFQTMSSWYFKAWFVSYVRHWAHNKFYVRLGEDRHDEKGLSANLTLFVRTRNVEYNISWNEVRNGLSHSFYIESSQMKTKPTRKQEEYSTINYFVSYLLPYHYKICISLLLFVF